MMSLYEAALRTRSGEQCELCGATVGLQVYEIPSSAEPGVDSSILVCETCHPQLEMVADLDSNHWYCLQQSIWSELPALQVVSWRMLKRLASESWAQDLLEQAYLEDSVLAWAQAGVASDEEDDGVKTLDSNGAQLFEGDSVTLIKDLDVKGTAFVAKRGTMVKGIHLTGDPENIEGRVNKMSIVLKTCFLKRVS